MAIKSIQRAKRALRRRRRVRGKLSGTAARPRLTVARSLNHVYAQLIDDENGVTMFGLSSNSKSMKAEIKDDMSKIDVAKLVGKNVASAAKEKGVEIVVFDRNQYRYHGRVKALADGAREGGLKF